MIMSAKVMPMRRLIRLLALPAVLVAASALGVSAAAAAPHGAAVAVNVCATASTYPPSTGPALAVSTTNPYRGQMIDVTGSGYCPDESVSLTLAGKVVGSAHTDGAGAFDPSVKIDVDPGTYQLVGTGAKGDSASATLTVRSSSGVEPVSTQRAPAGNGAAPQGNGGGGLAFTGIDIALIVGIAVLRLGGGGYLLHAGRRRHATH